MNLREAITNVRPQITKEQWEKLRAQNPSCENCLYAHGGINCKRSDDYKNCSTGWHEFTFEDWKRRWGKKARKIPGVKDDE